MTEKEISNIREKLKNFKEGRLKELVNSKLNDLHKTKTIEK